MTGIICRVVTTKEKQRYPSPLTKQGNIAFLKMASYIYDEVSFVFSTKDLPTGASLQKSQDEVLGCLKKAV